MCLRRAAAGGGAPGRDETSGVPAELVADTPTHAIELQRMKRTGTPMSAREPNVTVACVNVHVLGEAVIL